MGKDNPIEGRGRLGRLKNVGPWGRTVLEVPGSGSNYNMVPLANGDDGGIFQLGDVLLFDYDKKGYATNLRKPTKKEPLPHGWKDQR